MKHIVVSEIQQGVATLTLQRPPRGTRLVSAASASDLTEQSKGSNMGNSPDLRTRLLEFFDPQVYPNEQAYHDEILRHRRDGDAFASSQLIERLKPVALRTRATCGQGGRDDQGYRSEHGAEGRRLGDQLAKQLGRRT
jgi:hypothetical protein